MGRNRADILVSHRNSPKWRGVEAASQSRRASHSVVSGSLSQALSPNPIHEVVEVIELGNGYRATTGEIEHFVRRVVPHLYDEGGRTLRMPVYKIDARIRRAAEFLEPPQYSHIEIRMPDGLKSTVAVTQVARLLMEVETITIAEQLSQ